MEQESESPKKKTSSTELAEDFDLIVNEINDFIAILEERGQKRDPEEVEEPIIEEDSEDSSLSHSPRNTVIHIEDTDHFLTEQESSEPIYESFDDVKENDYEAIKGPVTVRATATATANLIPQATQKPELKPKPKHLLKMGEPNHQPLRVKSLHNFKGKNNDELCFNKGDIITVTQMMEGGWWEGTLGGKTGWFPSNYVREIKSDIVTTDIPVGKRLSSAVKGPEVQVYKRESMQYYHNVVLQNLIDTEKTHVQELKTVLGTYLQPIQNQSILSPTEYTHLVGNIEEILAFQNGFLSSIEECNKQLPHQRKVGGVFIKHAPRLKELYMEYSANHPRGAAILQNKRDDLNKYMETIGAPQGTMTLTTNLYKPFTRLDKYPSLLKELERHIEESHVDRGDTQRAIAVYRDILTSCMEIRKSKEMEYEILTSAIKGWEGEEIAKLGEVIRLSQVKLCTLAGDKYDRIFILFPNVLVMLSMSPRLSGYQYEGQLPLSGMNVCLNDEDEEIKSFEISGSMIEKIIVTCGSKTEAIAWLESLTQQVNITQISGTTKPQSLQISTSQPSISVLTQAKTAMVTHSIWSMSCLRPSPPLRQHLVCKDGQVRSPRLGRKPVRRKPDDPRTMEEDALILKVIEAYCTSAKTRHTVNSSIVKEKFTLVRPLPNPNLAPINENTRQDVGIQALPKESINVVKPLPSENSTNQSLKRDVGIQALLTGPHVLMPEEEKIIIDDGDPSNLQEKTLVDTVYSLKDQVRALEQEQKRMKKDLEDEQKARKRLENNIKKVLKNRTDFLWEENLT